MHNYQCLIEMYYLGTKWWLKVSEKGGFIKNFFYLDAHSRNISQSLANDKPSKKDEKKYIYKLEMHLQPRQKIFKDRLVFSKRTFVLSIVL